MQGTERQKVIVGAVVVSAIAIIAGAIFLAKSERFSKDEYIVLADIPNTKGLKSGDPVIMGGARVGIVLRVQHSEKADMPGAVRMSLSEQAFKELGAQSIAWVEPVTATQNMQIVIQAGKPEIFSRFVKIRPVRGIEPPPDPVIQ